MKRFGRSMAAAVWLSVCGIVSGCGNVSLRGDAFVAAHTSAMDAHQAYRRSVSDPTMPAWGTEYLAENYKQWRYLVRSAKQDAAWGPTIEGDPLR